MQQYYQKHQVEVPFYEDRLLCYQCYLTLDAMRFFAKSGQEEIYRQIRQNMLRKLNISSG